MKTETEFDSYKNERSRYVAKINNCIKDLLWFYERKIKFGNNDFYKKKFLEQKNVLNDLLVKASNLEKIIKEKKAEELISEEMKEIYGGDYLGPYKDNRRKMIDAYIKWKEYGDNQAKENFLLRKNAQNKLLDYAKRNKQ